MNGSKWCPPAAWVAGWLFGTHGFDIPVYADLARQHEEETGRVGALTTDPGFAEGAAEAEASPGW